MIDCKQALLKLYEFIDRELSPDDYAEVEEHLQQCKHCFAKAEFDRITKKIIREKANREKTPTYLKESIVQRIRQLNAASDSNPGNPGHNSRNFGPVMMVLSAAAAAILFIAGIFGFTMEGSAGTPGYMAMQYNALPSYFPLSDTPNDEQLQAAYNNSRPGFIPCYICDHVKILIAGSEKRGPRKIRKVVFEEVGEILIFYCLSTRDFNPGKKLKRHVISGREYQAFSDDHGCNVIVWKRNRCIDAVVGKMPVDKLLAYADKLN